ncbi:unnamed protein product [Durusdinium trenchii]|uniref:Uncharacterized protein n=1 Tax=Durusdinium trenchii TaxID=1381693 RepID=A0ABP0I143_9DINO
MPWWNPRRASLVLTFSLVALRPTLHTWVLSWHQVKRVATAARAAPTRAGPGPLRHLVEAQPELRGTKVGGEDAPVVFLLAPPSEHLTSYISEDPEGPFLGTSEWPDRLYEDVDGKNEPDEEEDAPGNWKSWNFQFSKREPFMLKADWHSVPGWGATFDIFVPRKNKVLPVRQAPPRVLAFLEAFRTVNEELWLEMTESLKVLRDQKPDDIPRTRLLDLLIEDFEERGFFGAIEAQAGPGRRKEMHWHKDGATGLLHMGITLQGQRRLRLRAWTDEAWEQEVFMSAGHIYLSSPFLFEHQVTYREDPTVALMCRFGFLDEEQALWVNHLRGRDMFEARGDQKRWFSYGFLLVFPSWLVSFLRFFGFLLGSSQ